MDGFQMTLYIHEGEWHVSSPDSADGAVAILPLLDRYWLKKLP